MSTTNSNDDWHLEIVGATLPRCPDCQSAELRVLKTRRPEGLSQDYKIQYAVCQGCDTRFRIDWE